MPDNENELGGGEDIGTFDDPQTAEDDSTSNSNSESSSELGSGEDIPTFDDPEPAEDETLYTSWESSFTGVADDIREKFDVETLLKWPDDYKLFINSMVAVPAYIRVTTPPTKTVYNDGDTIDFTGIVVTAYKPDGSTWNTTAYPNGVIPFSELTFPVTTANYPEEEEEEGE